MTNPKDAPNDGTKQLLDVSGLLKIYGREGTSEILTLFLKEMQELLDEGSARLAEENGKALSRVGHQIKGLSAFIICADMEPLSRQLEVSSQEHDWPKAAAAYESLVVLFKSVTVLINELLPSLSD